MRALSPTLRHTHVHIAEMLTRITHNVSTYLLKQRERDDVTMFSCSGYVCCSSSMIPIATSSSKHTMLFSLPGLTLVLAPHLARSYHHLFPLPMFTETSLPARYDHM